MYIFTIQLHSGSTGNQYTMTKVLLSNMQIKAFQDMTIILELLYLNFYFIF